jgi:hypothetical protein
MKFKLLVDCKDRATLDAALSKCVKHCFKTATVIERVAVGDFTTQEYRQAPAGVGPLAAVWDATPRKLIFDLCDRLEER